MKISNVKVYGLEDSFKASKYPMSVDVDSLTPSVTKTIKHLGSSKSGEGHDCFLKGIIVQYDLRCNHVMLPQFQRYHFHDIISSQSKMHRILKMNLKDCCDKYVREDIIDAVNQEIYTYNSMLNLIEQDPSMYTRAQLQEQYERIMSNLPMGLELTMRVTSNYLQLKSIHKQRKTHKMSFWREYCKWVEELPYFKELVLGQ